MKWAQMSVLVKEEKAATQILTVPLDELRWTLAIKRRAGVAGSDACIAKKCQKHIFQMAVVFWKSSSEIS